MSEVKNLMEERLLESSRRLPPELVVELIAYAEALANKEKNKIEFIETMRRLSDEAQSRGLTEEILKDILEDTK
jgi:hypothetical protein